MRRAFAASSVLHAGLLATVLLATIWSSRPSELTPVSIQVIEVGPQRLEANQAPAAEAAPLPKRAATSIAPTAQPDRVAQAPRPDPEKPAEPTRPPAPPKPVEPSKPVPAPEPAPRPPEPPPPPTPPKPEPPPPPPPPPPPAVPEPTPPKPAPPKPAPPPPPKASEPAPVKPAPEAPPKPVPPPAPAKPTPAKPAPEPPAPRPPRKAEAEAKTTANAETPTPPKDPPPAKASAKPAPEKPVTDKAPLKPAPDKPAAKDEAKPATKDEDSFAALLKSVENQGKRVEAAEARPGRGTAERPPEPGKADAAMLAGLIRDQVTRCWSIPAGVRDIRGMRAELDITFGPDGSVRNVTALDANRIASDTAFRAFAESAVRAVQACSPLELPSESYQTWRNVIFSFDPSALG